MLQEVTVRLDAWRMILLRDEILRNHRLGNIIIEPFDERRLNPNSYNLSLGDTLLTYDEVHLDSKKINRTKEYKMDPDEGFMLFPNVLYLGQTKEYTETRNLVPMIEGRSSIGRLGICIHVSAGFGDIGFCGHWTLEITVVHPIKVYAGMEICQVHFHVPQGTDREGYRGKYQNNRGVQASMLHEDWRSSKDQPK